MADADVPEWYTGDGLYRITATPFLDNFVPPERQIPFNLESAVVKDRFGDICVMPRVFHGDSMPDECVAHGVKLDKSFPRFVLDDNDDPNAVPASVPFILSTTEKFGLQGDYGSLNYAVRMLKYNAMTTRFVLRSIPPVITDSVFPERTFDEIDWYTGPGVYKVTYTAAYAARAAGGEEGVNVDYNRYVAVTDKRLGGGNLLIVHCRIYPHAMYQYEGSEDGNVSECIASAEKTPHDMSWFLLDPAPPVNQSHVYPLEKWNVFAESLPPLQRGQALAYRNNVVYHTLYTRYIHRQIRLDVFPDDTVSLASAAWRAHGETFRRRGEYGIGDRERYRETLPPHFRPMLDQHTSARFYV